MSNRFHTASDEEILQGKVTDVYFQRTLQVLKQKGIRRRVVMEVAAKSLPRNYPWGVLAGVEEIVHLLEGVPVTVRGLPEGSVFYPGEPVLEVEGYYDDFAVYETSILGFLCQATGIATAAARIRLAAGEKLVFSFGARRMHPAIAPMIERACYIGGCDGVAAVKSAELLGTSPVGTIPHALILVVGDTVKAFRLFDEVVEKDAPRIPLIDTFNDEKFEALRVAEAFGERLFGIRLDTPSSRRGNIRAIIEEVRWELMLRGYSSVKIVLSGGLDEKSVKELVDVVDAFGVGTYLSNSPVVDFSMDIVEIEGRPLAKKGKKSGRKEVLRCPQCLSGKVILANSSPDSSCTCGGVMKKIVIPFIKNGKIVDSVPSPDKIRAYVLQQITKLQIDEEEVKE